MRISTVIALFLLVNSLSAFADATSGKQDQHFIDSLKSVIEIAKHLPDAQAGDTIICNAYFDLYYQVGRENTDTALILLQNIRDLAEHNLASRPPPNLERRYLLFLAEALNNLGSIYTQQGDISKALVHYNKSLKIKEEIGYKKGIAISLNNIGRIYSDLGDIPKALEYYDRSLKIREEMGYTKGIAASLNNIGSIYSDQGDIVKALEYYQKCLKIVEEIGYENGIAMSLNNIGAIYYKQHDIPKALEYYRRSLKINTEIGHKKGVGYCMTNIGSALCKLDSIPEGIDYFKRALTIFHEIEDKQWLAYTYHKIAAVELKSGKPGSALSNASRAMAIAKDLGYPENIQRAAELLSKIHRFQGEHKDALEMYELHIQMRDSINNEKTQKATIRQQTKYEFEKIQMMKEQEEKELARSQAEGTKRRNNLQYSVIFIAILVLFGGVLALGFINVSERMIEGVIFFSFLILFEFLLVLADPTIDEWSGGAPGIKLLFNAGVAALIFPLHAFFEVKLKGRLVKTS